MLRDKTNTMDEITSNSPWLSLYNPVYQPPPYPLPSSRICALDSSLSKSNTSSLIFTMVQGLASIARPSALSPFPESSEVPDVLGIAPEHRRKSTAPNGRCCAKTFQQACLPNSGYDQENPEKDARSGGGVQRRKRKPKRRFPYDQAQRLKNFFLFRSIMDFDDDLERDKFTSYPKNSSEEDDIVMDCVEGYRENTKTYPTRLSSNPKRPHLPTFNPYCFPRRGKLSELHSPSGSRQTQYYSIHHYNIGSTDLRPLHTISHNLWLRGLKLMQDFGTNRQLRSNRGELWIDDYPLTGEVEQDRTDLLDEGLRCRVEMGDRLERLRPWPKKFRTVKSIHPSTPTSAPSRRRCFKRGGSSLARSKFWWEQIQIAEIMRLPGGKLNLSIKTPTSEKLRNKIASVIGQEGYDELLSYAAYYRADPAKSPWFFSDGAPTVNNQPDVQIDEDLDETYDDMAERHGQFIKQSLIPTLLSSGNQLWEVNNRIWSQSSPVFSPALFSSSQISFNAFPERLAPQVLKEWFDAYDERRREEKHREADEERKLMMTHALLFLEAAGEGMPQNITSFNASLEDITKEIVMDAEETPWRKMLDLNDVDVEEYTMDVDQDLGVGQASKSFGHTRTSSEQTIDILSSKEGKTWFDLLQDDYLQGWETECGPDIIVTDLDARMDDAEDDDDATALEPCTPLMDLARLRTLSPQPSWSSDGEETPPYVSPRTEDVLLPILVPYWPLTHRTTLRHNSPLRQVHAAPRPRISSCTTPRRKRSFTKMRSFSSPLLKETTPGLVDIILSKHTPQSPDSKTLRPSYPSKLRGKRHSPY